MEELRKPFHTAHQEQLACARDQDALGQDASPYLVVEDATKTYQSGSREIVGIQGVSFIASRGQLVAICGGPGAGKTTLLHLLGGWERPTTGQIWAGTQNIGTLNEDELAIYRWKTAGFVFQHVALLTLYPAWENVALPLWSAEYSEAEAKERAIACLQRVGLEAQQHSRPPELSRDEQQRIAIARALALRPALLLIDEPTDSLEVRQGWSLMHQLRQIAEEEQMVVVVTTHNPSMAQTAHRWLELPKGYCTDEGSAQSSRR
jgi:ABC-type lipoprotein export system ATPase subunit